MHKNRIFLARKESNAFLRKKNKFFFALKIQRIFIGMVEFFVFKDEHTQTNKNPREIKTDMEYKQVILVRQDLKMSKGKMAAQVAHASVEAMLKSHKDDIKKWRAQGMGKIVLKVANEKELFKFKQQCEDVGLVCGMITDAGHTELSPNTITCLGIGPDKEEKIDAITGNLKMM